MAVKIRMTRMGRRHRPFFRINAIESRNPRDGRIIEKLGHYDPIEKEKDKQVVLNRERIEYWLSVGAVPSDTVSEMLLDHGIKTKYAEEKAKRRAKARGIARAKGKFFNKAEKIAADKAVEDAAKAAEETAKAAEEAKKAAEDAKKAEEEAKAKAAEETAKAEEEAKAKTAEDAAKATEEAEKVEEPEKAAEAEEAKAEETKEAGSES